MSVVKLRHDISSPVARRQVARTMTDFAFQLFKAHTEQPSPLRVYIHRLSNIIMAQPSDNQQLSPIYSTTIDGDDSSTNEWTDNPHPEPLRPNDYGKQLVRGTGSRTSRP